MKALEIRVSYFSFHSNRWSCFLHRKMKFFCGWYVVLQAKQVYAPDWQEMFPSSTHLFLCAGIKQDVGLITLASTDPLHTFLLESW